MGNVKANSFICFFAAYIEPHSLIERGAKFHSFAASFMNVVEERLEFLISLIVTLLDDLVTLESSFRIFFTSHCMGYFGLFTDFHTSVSLIWRFSWLTDSRLFFLKISLLLILSLILELFRNLAILF